MEAQQPTANDGISGPSIHEDNTGNHVFDDVSLICPQDPRRMELTPLELVQSLEIKAAIHLSPEMDQIKDFDCAQLAIVDGDNRAKALERVQHFQIFREEYELKDTLEE
ncbi:hypothetical protein (Partial), partial [Seminavis robusta]|eukprot:Sro2614_g332640.1 n/a (108) ;mRNA; r:412-736